MGIAAFFCLVALFPLNIPDEKIYCTIIAASDKTPLRAFADNNGVWRYPIAIEAVSPLYLEALLGYEDRYFYHHPGVNPFSLVRAAWQWLKKGEVVSGGSTLTMQVARIFAPHRKTVFGKMTQILRALKLEALYSKQQILGFYINHAPFGGVIQGVQAAAYTYLGKSADTLSHAEAALLAVLPQSPTRIRPDRHPTKAKAARDKVISRLGALKIWDEKIAEDAFQEAVAPQYFRQPMSAPLFARRMKSKVSGSKARHTTIDAHLQKIIEQRLADFAPGLPEHTSTAILVVDNKTLGVRVYAGSADFTDSARFGHVDMIQAIRSPGSTLKPFLYAFALDAGLIHSESLLTDAPISFDGYRPGNFEGGFSGPVSVSDALIRSLNVPAVQVLDQLNPMVFYNRMLQGGLKLHLPKGAAPNLSMILGGAGARLEDLVAAYAGFARKGVAGHLRFFEDEPLKERYMMSEGAAWIIAQILGPLQRSKMNFSFIDLPDHRRIGWKTGTSFGFRDALAIGFGKGHTVGVWVGRPDGTPVPGHYGAITASPILFSVFEAIDDAGSRFSGNPQPASVTSENICWPGGITASAVEPLLCHEKRLAFVLGNTIPPTFADPFDKLWTGPVHRIWIDEKTGLQVTAGCKGEFAKPVEIPKWPVAVTPWLSRRILKKTGLPPMDPSCGHLIPAQEKPVIIQGPPDGTILTRAVASNVLPAVTLRVLGTGTKVMWLVNGKVEKTASYNEIFVRRFDLPGEYTITVVDEDGNFDSMRIVVMAT